MKLSLFNERVTMPKAILLIIFVGLVMLYIFTGAPTITTEFGSSDSGELATAVVQGGVAHPPGYPTYLLFGRVVLMWPWGEAAGRLIWLNSLCIALAALFLAASLPDPNIPSILATMLVFGLNPKIWQQALVVEVYALALLFFCLLLWLTKRYWHNPNRRTIAALGLVFGLGLGIQLPIAVWLIGIGVVWLVERKAIHWRDLALFCLMMMIGLSSYLVLIWRGNVAPEVSWGDWTTVNGIVAHISAREYRYLVGSVPLGQMLGRLSFVVRDVFNGVGWLGFGLAIWGLIQATPTKRWHWLTLGIAVPTLLWAISYGGSDAEVYLLPIHALAAWWAGVGVKSKEQRAESKDSGVGIEGDAPNGTPHFSKNRVMIVSMILVVIGAWGLRQLPSISLHNATQTRDQAIAQLQAIPAKSTLQTNADQVTFPLWYAQQVLGIRPDVIIQDQRLLQYEWYRRRFNR